ncbi:Anaphase-promoting complex subunit 23 [Lobosporangium transversale]|uniref:Anaphase promoting complex subunit 8 n=1 Tax=Lobosporangium transversale TaxID=64571 RepID=A0A1Y2GK19_9FUNG|nr:anaphase promoting complex subunit 8 [Lobosporangium transversale]KAF9914170.1 Anaphase-promoting complex subunit 23 [Lobosporangium transversale]ORZ13370.1 anaphase promoting complex subunit 8 [Lobosporangium transversale]|eukprot:XP_021880451.1 anaphase promoting complex subunit 8 [Lobosporangium transversale]
MQTTQSAQTGPAWTLDIAETRVELREAVQACNERGLYFSARWAAEALNGLPTIGSSGTHNHENGLPSTTGSLGPETHQSGHHISKYVAEVSLYSSMAITEADLAEFDTYLMAKTFFDLKEYDRCVSVLEERTSHKSRFLRLYSKYLAGERRREQDTREVLGPLDNAMAVNRELESIYSELTAGYQAGILDSFCKYLYGLILIKQQRKTQAIAVLIESINQYPYNWSAWQDLSSCLLTFAAVTNIQSDLPVSFMTTYFLSYATQEYFSSQQEDAVVWLEELSEAFPRSAYVKCQRAIALYHARDFPEAANVFEELITENPHRLDNLDIFSNVLFVTENRARLSFLAHSCAKTDNYRPETCCIIGNYYSMKAEHEKAVVYFKKALRFNRSYASAWTLLGHEYLEMKNTYAAVESYRRAVDFNHRDYRAWNGLGQTYEVLKMHYYALNYYQRATAIRPYDGRMWCAMAECYEYLDQDLAAIKCYTRALLGSDQEKMALKKLPKLYKKIDDTEAAAHYFRKSLEQLREEQSESEDTSEACIFLALYERERGNLAAALDYATEAMQCSSEQHQEDARALMRDIRSVLDAGETSEID